MPALYAVSVLSPDSFQRDEPVVFKPIAHTTGQALRLVQDELRKLELRGGLMHGTTSLSVEQEQIVGGYDSPEIEQIMKGHTV